MPTRLLVVGFENVNKVDLSAIPADVTVPCPFGGHPGLPSRENPNWRRTARMRSECATSTPDAGQQ